MVEHIVLFKWKDDTSPDAIEAAIDALRDLRNRVPGIVDISCGTNFSERGQGFHTGLVVRFQDRAALDAYGPHPEHQRVVQNFISPYRIDVLAVDYEID